MKRRASAALYDDYLPQRIHLHHGPRRVQVRLIEGVLRLRVQRRREVRGLYRIVYGAWIVSYVFGCIALYRIVSNYIVLQLIVLYRIALYCKEPHSHHTRIVSATSTPTMGGACVVSVSY